MERFQRERVAREKAARERALAEAEQEYLEGVASALARSDPEQSARDLAALPSTTLRALRDGEGAGIPPRARELAARALDARLAALEGGSPDGSFS